MLSYCVDLGMRLSNAWRRRSHRIAMIWQAHAIVARMPLPCKWLCLCIVEATLLSRRPHTQQKLRVGSAGAATSYLFVFTLCSICVQTCLKHSLCSYVVPNCVSIVSNVYQLVLKFCATNATSVQTFSFDCFRELFSRCSQKRFTHLFEC